MVSGFFTSPCDHWRIFSGDASEMRIALNESGSFGFSKKLKMSFTFSLFLERSPKNLRRCARLLGGRNFSKAGRRSVLHQLHVEAERLQLLDEHVEALGQARLQRVLTLH